MKDFGTRALATRQQLITRLELTSFPFGRLWKAMKLI